MGLSNQLVIISVAENDRAKILQSFVTALYSFVILRLNLIYIVFVSGYSWVTLATNDSYSLGALVLAHSLKQVGTKQQLTVLITPGVTQAMR